MKMPEQAQHKGPESAAQYYPLPQQVKAFRLPARWWL
jgi:hypothetical protein